MDNSTHHHIHGIQQVGIGCEDFARSWEWYIKMFSADIRVLEDDTVAERMLPYTGGQPQKRHACIALNLQGGGGFEIWQYSQRKPVPCPFPVECGSLGIFCCKTGSPDVEAFHRRISSAYSQVSALSAAPDGSPTFFILDPWGNYFQVVTKTDLMFNRKGLSCGVTGAMIGVSDMDRSLPFYRRLLGYDQVIYDKTGSWTDLQLFPNGGEQFRRVLLAPSSRPEGAFSQLYGRSTIELVQALDSPARRLYEGRFWGDPGFIQVCFDVSGLSQFEQTAAEFGCPFTVDSDKGGENFTMGDADGRFAYIEDPDHTLIELVEARRITLSKHPRLCIDLTSRRKDKPLPKTLLRLLALKRVNPKSLQR